jgi:hypothetical protein
MKTLPNKLIMTNVPCENTEISLNQKLAIFFVKVIGVILL